MPEYAVNIKLNAQDNASPQLNKVNKEVNDLDDNAQKSGKGLASMGGSVMALGSAIAGLAIVQKAGEILELGKAANAADRTFTQLSGGAASASVNLASLRAATSGVVSDMELMAGANKMMITGLATSAKDVAGLTELGVKLSAAMGVGATEGLDNFIAAMNNMSFERLDTLGISASKVRERVAELKQEGLDTQEAFKLATLEEGRKTLDKLGESVEANISSIDKLKVRLENGIQDFGQWAAEGVDKAATSLENLIGIIQAVGEHGLGDTLQAGLNTDNFVAGNKAAGLADAGVEAFAEFMDMGNVDTTMTGLQMQEMLEMAFTMVEQDPTLKSNWNAVVEGILGSPFDASSPTMIGLRDSLAATYNMVSAEATILAGNQARELSRFVAYQANTGAGMQNFDQMQMENYNAAKYSTLADMYGGTTGAAGGQQMLTDFFAGGNAAGFNDIIGQSNAAQDMFSQFQGNAGGIGSFIDASQFEGIEKQFEKLQELNEQGFISDANLEAAQTLRDEAERAAKAFEDMSLTDIFGQSGGGMKGEIGDMVMGELGGAGLTDEQLAAIERQFNLGSGRETASSVAMTDTVVPVIADLAKTDPAMAQQAIDNVNAFLEAAALMGLDDAQIAGGLQGATGFQAGGASGMLNITPGQTAGDIMGASGLTLEQLLAITGASGANTIPTGSFSYGTGYAPVGGFDPMMYAQGMGGGIGPQMGSGGMNPFMGLGVSPTAWAEDASVAGAESPFAKQVEDTQLITENQQVMVDKSAELNDSLLVVNDTMDLIAEPRTATIKVTVDDQTGGLLAMLSGGLVMVAGKVGGKGSSPVVPGDPRVGGRPGFTR